MKNSRKLAVLLCLFIGCLDVPTPGPGPDGKPANTFGLEVSIPPTMPNAADAAQLAAVYAEFARVLELDGQQAEPVVATTKDLETRLAKMANYFYLDHRLSTDAFLSVVNQVKEREIQQESDAAVALTPELRRKAVEVNRAIAYGLRQVK